MDVTFTFRGLTFRESYRRMNVLGSLVTTPVVAMTGTATPEIAADVVDFLGLRNPRWINAVCDRSVLASSLRDFVRAVSVQVDAGISLLLVSRFTTFSSEIRMATVSTK